MPVIIDLNKHFFVNLLFGRSIRKFREWKIKRYKAKKVKTEARNSTEKIYHMQFKIAIRDNNAEGSLAQCDTIFDIKIPANGYYFAKKQLERFVVANIDVEVVDFESLPDENTEIKTE